MNDVIVRVMRLEPMRVAVAYGFGPSPEMLAWEKISAFARSKGLLNTPQRPRFFGFNNPNPSAGSPNYGYEQWMTIPPSVQAEGEITVKEIPGDLYAVLRFQGLDYIGAMWDALVVWVKSSPYRLGPGQCLEELISPVEDLNSPDKFVFDLYLPVVA